ncbi:hypothetical protein [Ursidibacter sp. B-7004-1]
MMNSPMQQLKIKTSLLDQMETANNRILTQATFINNEPIQYQGETLRHAIQVINWHCEEQANLIDTLRGYIKRINKLIDDADKVLQGGNNE